MKPDLNFIRSQFPAFEQPHLKGWAFFENAGGSYPCRQVIDRLTKFYTRNKVQPYYPYPASTQAGEAMDEAYRRVAAYLNADPSEIHFGPSTTQNVYVLANAMRPMWQEGDEIIVSCQDHEANAGAWRRLGERGLKITEWHVEPDTGMLDTAVLRGLMSERTRLVAYPHCSNVIGQINPVREISQMARSIGALTAVDGVGWAPHEIPDVQELGADIYMFSSYKTYGPHLGVMYVRGSLIGKMENQSHFFKEGITRNMLTPAGPDHAQIAAAAGMADYFDAVYAHHFDEEASAAAKGRTLNQLFRTHEKDLLQPLLEFLREREDVRIVGPASGTDRAPIVSILPLNKTIDQVYDTLTRHRLMTGKGNFYAYRPLMDMDIPRDPGVIRLSFVHYTSPEEIRQLIEGLREGLERS
ncbi:aminotransferase class V-fold PLP-dependent enzyme [Robiginitalea sp. SC105]|uniref:aminotransferase class V-fold PLP-dependent enzyme n=1 Tax=Robiginitalea sp. SC105 TaxID=2762332 RepID=UPI00163A3B2F|nr:aminotransferase class V-fold PLP-dependent enzyme [Robiginitalea sp. SC105]MBC2837746.1 aminotransferase class V-fold PLP-dependent enzyme [Robiginitalea sp. SC105]